MIRLDIRDRQVLCMAAAEVIAERFETGPDADAILTLLPKPLAPDAYGPHLQAIGTCTTGTQHIDREACERFGIRVVSLEGDEALRRLTGVAEHTFGLIWAITRVGTQFHEWDRSRHLARFMLSRASLGIVGLGRIGSQVADLARAYGLKVCINEAAWDCDIVSLHLPLNDQTRGTVDEARLARMKRGAYLINTARGELVDDRALLEALRSGHLAGYAADVLSGEFEPGFDHRAHPLWKAMITGTPVVLTPHIGGSTLDSWEATQLRILDKLEALCSR